MDGLPKLQPIQSILIWFYHHQEVRIENLCSLVEKMVGIFVIFIVEIIGQYLNHRPLFRRYFYFTRVNKSNVIKNKNILFDFFCPVIDKTLIVWKLTREESSYGIPQKRLYGHSHFISDVVLSSDGNYALSGSWDKTLRLWDLAAGKTTRRFEDHTKVWLHWLQFSFRIWKKGFLKSNFLYKMSAYARQKEYGDHQFRHFFVV